MAAIRLVNTASSTGSLACVTPFPRMSVFLVKVKRPELIDLSRPAEGHQASGVRLIDHERSLPFPTCGHRLSVMERKVMPLTAQEHGARRIRSIACAAVDFPERRFPDYTNHRRAEVDHLDGCVILARPVKLSI